MREGQPSGRSLPTGETSVSPNEMAGFHRRANLHDVYLFVGIAAARGRDDPRLSGTVTFPKRSRRLSQMCESS